MSLSFLPSDADGPLHRAAVALVADAMHPTGHVGLGPALRAYAALAVHPTAVVTAVRPLTALPGRLVRDQLERALIVAPDAIGVGDPGDDPAGLAEGLIDAVADGGPATGIPIIVAPNAVDRQRTPRFEPGHLARLAERLFPHAEAVVLDSHEAALLTGREAPDLRRMREAARRIHDRGPRWVIITGGRSEGHAVDLAWDGSDFTEFGCSRAPIERQAGAGSVFGALLVGWRARGLGLLDALDHAKRGVTAALAHATAVGRVNRVDPLGPALAALGIDPRPIAPLDAEEGG